MLATCAVATAFSMAGFGGVAKSEAQPAPVPDYFWCPGQPFDPAWGPNWDPTTCHDEFQRYIEEPVPEDPALDDPGAAPPPAAGGGGA